MHDSAIGRLIAVLVSPARAFESIARRPTWVVPFVVLTLLGVVSAAVVMPRIDMEEEIRRSTERQGQTLSDEQIEQFAGISEKVGFGCAVFLPPVGYLLFALVLMVAFNLVGGEVKFPVSFSTTLHAILPQGVAALLIVPVALGTEQFTPEQVQARSFLASSAAAFAPEGTGPVLLALLSSLDLFAFWSLALLVIGYSIAAGVSRGKAAATVVTLWVVWLAVKVGLAALGAAFGGGAG